MSLVDALKNIKFEQYDVIMNLKAKYSVQSALDIIEGHEQTLNDLSKKYGIPKEYIQAMLFRELRCYDFRDDIADGIVHQNILYDEACREAVQSDDYKKLLSVAPAFINTRDSSTGIGQIYARTAIDAINVGIELGLVNKEELGIPNEIDLDATNQEAISYIWKRLYSDDKFNLEASTLNLISEAYESVE